MYDGVSWLERLVLRGVVSCGGSVITLWGNYVPSFIFACERTSYSRMPTVSGGNYGDVGSLASFVYVLRSGIRTTRRYLN